MNVTQACRKLEQWLEQGEIEVATHRCGLDRLLAMKPHGHQAMLNGDSEQGLEQWGRQNALHWQETLGADAFAERFDVGHGRTYGCIEQMPASTTSCCLSCSVRWSLQMVELGTTASVWAQAYRSTPAPSALR